MSDFKDIKTRILEENRIEELLNKMECENVKERSNRFEARLPDKFESDNGRSVQVYLNENISCKIRSKGVSYGMDIFGLVGYIVFDLFDKESQNKNSGKSKRWICQQLGYENSFSPIAQKDSPLKWLNELKKKRKKSKRVFQENQIYDDSILNQYIMLPNKMYIDEGIDYQTQLFFKLGFDIHSERIVFPIYNSYGEIISVKGRTIDPDYKKKDIPKFMYFPNFNKMLEIYNWSNAVYYILEKKEVIIFEGEKSCWLAYQFGHMNAVAISGDDLSEYQVELIKNLGMDINIIIALDKDKTPDDFKKQAAKFGHTRRLYALWDADNLLSKELKHSPTDLGFEVFEKLYETRYKYRIKNTNNKTQNI